MAAFDDDQSAADVEALLEEFASPERGGFVNEACEFVKTKESGISIMAKEALTAGSTVVGVPYDQLLSTERIMNYEPLRRIFVEQEQLRDFPDEVLAIGIMHAACAGAACPWYKHVATFPIKSINSTIFWSDEELEELKGCNVYILTQMMNKQMAADWEAVHAALKQIYPDLLGGISLSMYKWAMSMIYSRAVGIHNAAEKYERVIPPALDFANHHPDEAEDTASVFSFDRESNTLKFKVGKDKNAGEECFAMYGPYSNAKLAYNYGFVLVGNPHRGVDLWTKPGPNTTLRQVKQEIIGKYDLTKEQSYDFEGTIKPGYVRPALLSILRICNANAEEVQQADKIQQALNGKMMSVRNETAAYASLKELLEANIKQERLVEDKLDLHEKLVANGDTANRKVMALIIRIDEQELYKETIEYVERLSAELEEKGDSYIPPDGR